MARQHPLRHESSERVLQQRFRLSPKGAIEFVAEYRPGFRNFELLRNDEIVFECENLATDWLTLQRRLGSGEELTCRYVSRSLFGSGVQVTIAGVPMLGSAAAGESLLRQAGICLFIPALVWASLGVPLVFEEEGEFLAIGAATALACAVQAIIATLCILRKPLAGQLAFVVYVIMLIGSVWAASKYHGDAMSIAKSARRHLIPGAVGFVIAISALRGARQLTRQISMGQSMSAEGIQVPGLEQRAEALRPFGEGASE